MMTRLLFHRTVAAAALIFSFTLTVFAVPVAVRAANVTVKLVSPADGATVYWTNAGGNEMYYVKVAPENPANPPACFMAILEYRKPPGSWIFVTGVSDQITQKHPISLPVNWFGDDAVYRIKAAGNEGCKNYGLGDDDNYVWTDWNQYTIEQKELAALNKDQFEAVSKKPILPVFGSKAALQKDLKIPPGGAPSTPMSGDAPTGLGAGPTPAAVQKVKPSPGDHSAGKMSAVKIMRPTDGSILYWTNVTGKEMAQSGSLNVIS
jgi:hypothetical protein